MYMYSLDNLAPGHWEKSNLPIRTLLVSKTKDRDLFLTKNKSKILVNINNTCSAMAKLETRQKFEVFESVRKKKPKFLLRRRSVCFF